MADDLGAVRRTPRPTPHLRSTGDRQTPETGPQESAGTTNSPTLVSTDAGNGTDDLSPEVAAALIERHGPEIEALSELGAHILNVTSDLQAYAELPECTACDGSGKDDHGTPFEAPLAVHFAGPPIEIAGRRRQLCMWCGHVLIDVPLADGQTAWPPWPKASLVRVEDGTATLQPYTYGDPLPPGCCALPDDDEPVCPCDPETERCTKCADEPEPASGIGCYPPADGWDGVAVRAAADRTPAAVEADNALRLHLASVHKLANAFALTAADAADAHQHDHFGPCGLRNHDVADRSYDEAVAHAVVAEADDGPDEAQENRAAADWPAEETS